MSLTRNSSIFSLLESNHDAYLLPYRYAPPSTLTSCCDLLLTKIHLLCTKYDPPPKPNETGAIKTILTFLKSCRNKRIFRELRETVRKLERGDAKGLLRRANAAHAQMYERGGTWRVRFKLSGEQFPPRIVYRLVCVFPYVTLNDDEGSRGVVADQWHTFYVYRFFKLKKGKKKKRRKKREEFAQHRWIDEVY